MRFVNWEITSYIMIHGAGLPGSSLARELGRPGKVISFNPCPLIEQCPETGGGGAPTFLWGALHLSVLLHCWVWFLPQHHSKCSSVNLMMKPCLKITRQFPGPMSSRHKTFMYAWKTSGRFGPCFSLFSWCFVCFKTEFLCSPGCPGILSVNHAGFDCAMMQLRPAASDLGINGWVSTVRRLHELRFACWVFIGLSLVAFCGSPQWFCVAMLPTGTLCFLVSPFFLSLLVPCCWF